MPNAGTKPRTDFERTIAVEMPAMLGLARRLVDDTLRPIERQGLEMTKAILRLQGQNYTQPQMCEELKVKLPRLASFVTRGTFRVCSKWLRERETSTDSKVVDQREKAERARFEALGGKALDFLELCFERDPKGQYKSKVDAKWATAIVAKGKGWDERSEHTRMPDIKIGVIVAQQQAIRKSDATYHGGRVVVEVGGQRATVALPEPAPPAPLSLAEPFVPEHEGLDAKSDELFDLEEGAGAIESEDDVEVEQIPAP